MKIVLATPYSVGDLAPDESFPHCYITQFYVNGAGRNATITYEVGSLAAPSDTDPMGLWTKAPFVPAGTLQIVGADLYPFFSNVVNTDPSVSQLLWDQVETLLYTQIQAAEPRLAGELK